MVRLTLKPYTAITIIIHHHLPSESHARTRLLLLFASFLSFALMRISFTPNTPAGIYFQPFPNFPGSRLTIRFPTFWVFSNLIPGRSLAFTAALLASSVLPKVVEFNLSLFGIRGNNVPLSFAYVSKPTFVGPAPALPSPIFFSSLTE